MNCQSATQLSKPFLHSSDADAKLSAGVESLALLRRNTLALVLHLHANLVVELKHADPCHRASSVAVNIRETFLHYPENSGFHILWEPAEVIRKLEINPDLAAF